MGVLELRRPELVPFVLNDIVLNDSCRPVSHAFNVIIHVFLPGLDELGRTTAALFDMRRKIVADGQELTRASR
jgi:hypothetical protein